MKEPASGKCVLCDRENDRLHGAICSRCAERISRAHDFNSDHFEVPTRYRDAKVEEKYLRVKESGSCILIGVQGVGKTYLGYGLMQLWAGADPRLRAAAYSWPVVLMELRRSFGGGDQIRANSIIDALRNAQIAMLDDLGAERITGLNADWIRETLFVVLDHRWSWKLPTILTSNFAGEELKSYLGPRVASRIAGMCEPVLMVGGDRRMEGK